MTIYIGSKPPRFNNEIKFPEIRGFTRIDVTSGSMTRVNYDGVSVPTTQFSPLLLGPCADDEDVAKYMENLWQYSKVYPQLGHWDDVEKKPSQKWKLWREKGFSSVKKAKGKEKGIRTPPEISKLKKLCRENGENWAPKCSWWKEQELDYVTSRKLMYVPEYSKVVVQTKAFQALKNMVSGGVNILIIDYDGPDPLAYPNGMLMDEKNFLDQLNNTSRPFGHGYVVAALLAGLDIDSLCKQ